MPFITILFALDLIITGTGNFTLAGGGSLTGGGTFSIAVGGTMSVTGNVTLNGASNGTVNGTLNVFGNFTDSNGGNSTCGTGNINISGAITGASICGTVVLPVTFTKFYARQKDKTEELFWQTASEQNNRLFEIERSTDGIEFEKIGYNGNINHYILMNENDKGKYYFENKIILCDDYYNDIKIIYGHFLMHLHL
jgi:hypothetical protein